MKNKIFLLVIIVSIWSCGSGGGDTPTPTPPPPPENKAPEKTVLANPTNGKLCIDNSVSFSWNKTTDPDNDSVKYLLEIATDNNFTQIAEKFDNLSETSKTVSLTKGTAYYWRVRAKDSKNLNGDYSSTFNFYTEGEGVVNHLPFSPELVSPALNKVIKKIDYSPDTDLNVILEWNSSDVDNNPLTYTIYLDTVNPPVSKVSENQTEKTLIKTLTANTTYYWKIEVSDDKGGTTVGQVWTFATD